MRPTLSVLAFPSDQCGRASCCRFLPTKAPRIGSGTCVSNPGWHISQHVAKKSRRHEAAQWWCVGGGWWWEEASEKWRKINLITKWTVKSHATGMRMAMILHKRHQCSFNNSHTDQAFPDADFQSDLPIQTLAISVSFFRTIVRKQRKKCCTTSVHQKGSP